MIEAYSATLKERISQMSTVVGSTSMRYGRQEDVRGLFDKISALKDSPERDVLIEQLLTTMESNNEQNGFFARKDSIRLIINDYNLDSPQISIDDMQVYKMFFDNYAILKLNNPTKSAGAIHSAAVKQTVKDYFGEFKGNSSLRLSLTKAQVNFGEDDTIETIPASIAKLKGRNIAMCTERASLSHNLWLIGGYESYFVESSSIRFNNSTDQGHSYCLVNTNNTFKLFDTARDIYTAFEEGRNVADEVLNGHPLKVQTTNGTEMYANAQTLETAQ